MSALSNTAGLYPETLGPGSTRRHGLKARPLAFMRQVYSADDRRERLKTDEFTRLSVGTRRQPDGGDGVFGSEQRLHFLAARFDPEVRAAESISLQVGETVVHTPSLERERIGYIEGTHFAGG